MSDPRIDVQIGAKVDGLAAGVTQASEQLGKLGNAAGKAAPQFDKLKSSTSNYNAVGVNFARLIQDAPFGIIGVGNNITALAESFQVARNQGQSLTQILGGVFSSGNLLTLGISALITAWTLYQQNATKAKSVNEEAEKTFKDLADQVEKTGEILGTVDFVDTLINKQLELNKATDQSTNIFRDFGKATEEAFGNLNPDQLTSIKNVYEELSGKQLQTLGNALGKTRKEVIEFVKSFKGNEEALESLDPKIRDAVTGYNSFQEKVKLAGDQLEFFSDKADKVPKGKTALEKYSEAFDLYELQVEQAKIATDRLTISQDNLFKSSEKTFKSTNDITNALQNIGKVKIELPEFPPQTDIADQLPFLDQLETALNPKKFTEFEQRIADFAFTVRDLLQNNLAAAFSDLGYSIGEALATGGNVIQAVGQSVLKSFGRFLGQFGEQLIAYGVATIAFGKASIGLSNPFTAIPSGGLAIAAGVALTAISGIIGSLGKKGMGGGGGGGGASVGSSGVGGGSSFVGGAQGGLFASQRDLNGELVIRGQDLVYVFNQANNRINKG